MQTHGAGVDDFCRAADGELTEEPHVKPAVHATGLKFVERYNREAVKEALVKHGPLSIGVDAEPLSFRFYSGGVLNVEDCYSDPDHIDHAVLLVGYGVEDGTALSLVQPSIPFHCSAYTMGAGVMVINQMVQCELYS